MVDLMETKEKKPEKNRKISFYDLDLFLKIAATGGFIALGFFILFATIYFFVAFFT